LLARVFQVVDVFDALSNKRPYRDALPADEVIEIIREETARGFWDEAIVDEFLVMVAEGESVVDDGSVAT
jgi:putative two-component system response regulator